MDKREDIKQVEKLIRKYIEELKKRKIDVVAAYLFGSYAKGKASPWSDIDVAILTKKFIGDSFDFKFLLMKIAREVDLDIEPHPYLLDEFTENNPVAVEVLKTGRRVA